MRIQPRQEILAAWKALVKWSVVDGKWRWGGQVAGNSISDAEQLLCLLYPASKLRAVRFDRPDLTHADVIAAFAAFGKPLFRTAVDIPLQVVRIIKEYLEHYTDPANGIPVFAGGSYYITYDSGDPLEPTDLQRKLEVVDSFATSVVLMVAVIEFLRGYRRNANKNNHALIDEAEGLASRRLSAAMVGLQRSFTINVFSADSEEGKALCRTVGQRDDFDPGIVGQLRFELRDVIGGLRELGTWPQDLTLLEEHPDRLFECGWSWSVVRGAPPVHTEELGTFDRDGVAESAPYLYFTVVAVDSIRDLTSSRARVRGLLNEEQQQLLRTLGLQWELARRYWSIVATLGEPDWPLEDIPWRTTDGDETDYYTLLITNLVLQDQLGRRAQDSDFRRISDILGDLADRSRIRRRPFKSDTNLTLHDPGTPIRLVGSESASPGAPQLGWLLADLAPLLLGRTLLAAQEIQDPTIRSRTLGLADEVWRHIERRRLSVGRGSGLWDQPARVFPQLSQREETPSWYFTNRVVQCLGVAATLIESSPPPSQRILPIAADLLVEAEQLFDNELLHGSQEGGPALSDDLRRVGSTLQRARKVLRTRPGTAVALISEVLQALDKLEAARDPEVGD